MRGEVVACGDELLHGAALDTNSKYIAAELESAGVPVHRFTVLSDDPEGLKQGIGDACARSEVVVLTGGLGPTLDDRTRDVVAELCGSPPRFHEESWQQIQTWLRSRGRPVPDSNRRQAMLPGNAEPLANPVGSAPGFRVALGRATLFALPGVPREMHRMLADHVLPFVRALPGCRPTAAHYLRIVGPSEALLGERLESWMVPGRDPAVGITATYGMLTVRVVGTGPDLAQAKAACLRVAAELRPVLANWIVAEGNDDLAVLVGKLLIERGLTLALAESCTGGLLAARLTDVPGISAVFLGGLVTYADAAKVRQLGVDPDLLARHGAVSEPVATAMAAGAARLLDAQLGLAITGIAGPGGGTPEKPVGTVCFAVCRAGKDRAWTVRIPDLGREFVRERAVVEALTALLRAGQNSA
jgi:nicotinamide-nucleotide amidase